MVYIAIYEPHENGSWHIHLVYSGVKGLTVELLEKLWDNGFVYIEPFNALAAPYFCSKNDRLAYYPSGCRLYSTSKNIKEPIEKQFSPEIFKMLIEKTGMHCTGAQARTLYKIEANETKRVNHFIYMNFQK